VNVKEFCLLLHLITHGTLSTLDIHLIRGKQYSSVFSPPFISVQQFEALYCIYSSYTTLFLSEQYQNCHLFSLLYFFLD